MLSSFNSRNIIKLSHKATPTEEIDKINQVLLDNTSENMVALVKTDKCGCINTTDKTTMGYYMIKLITEPYTLQEETTCDGKISTAGELFVKLQYMNYMQDNKKWYWEKPPQQKNIIVTTCTIVHP